MVFKFDSFAGKVIRLFFLFFVYFAFFAGYMYSHVLFISFQIRFILGKSYSSVFFFSLISQISRAECIRMISLIHVVLKFVLFV